MTKEEWMGGVFVQSLGLCFFGVFPFLHALSTTCVPFMLLNFNSRRALVVHHTPRAYGQKTTAQHGCGLTTPIVPIHACSPPKQ